jgi:tRNA threonylcarbamoyl adenosine modification protein YjeE
MVLSGPLGAGKTVFAKGLAQGLGVAPDEVVSPTFAICSEYDLADGRRLAHLDAYRLESAAELESAGFLDLLVAGTIVLIEWGERFRDALPADRLEIEISRPDAIQTQRRLEAVACGPAAGQALVQWGVELVGEIGRQLDLELLEEKSG